MRYPLLASAALAAAFVSQAIAAPPQPSLRALAPSSAAAWTDADYLRAKALDPRVRVLPDSIYDYNAAMASTIGVTPRVVAGGRGGRDASRLESERILGADTSADADGAAFTPEAVGTLGLHFTSSRVSPKALDKTFPVRTVGKLYFKIGLDTYMCTGSLVKPGVVLTAGHCVHSGNGAASGWYNSFQFIPGYRKVGNKITQPYGAWSSWAYVITSTTWYAGGGGVPNAEDFALIVFNTDGSSNRVGDYTGWLGYGYPFAIGRHNTILGYPGNLDLGGQLHRVDSVITNYGSLNTGTYGSDMQGGSSGGPWVLNWRVDYTDSSTLPSENFGNIATAVVSWGYVDPSPKVQGGSQFNATFFTMVNQVCTNYAWAC